MGRMPGLIPCNHWLLGVGDGKTGGTPFSGPHTHTREGKTQGGAAVPACNPQRWVTTTQGGENRCYH